MTERAQALEAVIAYLDAIDEIATIGAAPKHHTGQSAMPPPYNMTPSTAKNIKWNTREIRSRLALLAVQPPPPVGSPTTDLKADDVEWVVNDSAELGVKIGNQFFWCYKGHSLVYETGAHDDGSPMHWRPVFKREFGECIHPINYASPTRIGTVSRDDSDDWQPLLSTPVEPAGASEPPSEKHRMTCASRLVVFGDDNEPVNCGLPCDCDNPAKWVEVPVSPRAVRVAAEEANGAGGMPGIATRQRGRRGLATD